jgi:sulfatase modifying factor 1
MSMHKLSSMILAGAVAAFAVVARGDVFNLGGTRNPDGSWTGLASLETVPVGNVGNKAVHPAGQGAVSYNFNIGKYEVTAGQYTEFLNAVADTDAYGLYRTSMWSSTYGCKIQRTGSSGSYTYSVAADWANRPVNFVSWGDAARFANWLHNGQPTGAQGLATTEDGAYYLNGATTAAQLRAVTRQTDWKWAITSEDEWFKAAYHKNDGDTGNYFKYPTSSNSVPSMILGTPTDPGNNATFYNSVYTIGSPYWMTEVGAHENSDSPYGTFDQGGNVLEWNEAIAGSSRAMRGGSFDYSAYYLASSVDNDINVTFENYDIGFRVANVPEPGSLILIVSGAIAALILWRRRK